MSFTSDLKLFAAKVQTRQRDVFVGSVTGVADSVVDGSTVTGAPGQPVDVGNLKNSWQTTFPSVWVGMVATNVEYAPAIEEGQQPPYTTASGKVVTPKPMTLRSKVGGFHSVKMTRAAWTPLVEQVVAEVVK